MKQFIYRKLPDSFKNHIYIWDVDKTYLNTHFESKRGLLKIFFEAAIDKKGLPGVKNLLLELRKGASDKIELHPLFFISASPLQLKKILEGKFLIDGVQHDGIILKDYRHMRSKVGKLRLKNNFPYKLISLLTHRCEMPKESLEILFGDDFESDADVYSLYADILKGEFSEEEVRGRLKKERFSRSEIRRVLKGIYEVRRKENPKEVVKKIFIHLIRHPDPASFERYGSRLVATRNYMQTSAVLYAMGKISKRGFQRVANSFNLKYPADGWTLEKSLKDLLDRNLITSQIYDDLRKWK